MLQGGNEMKTNLKKGLSLVLALVMVFAMTTAAFANANDTINYTVEFAYGENYEYYEDSFTEAFTRTAYSTEGKVGTAIITDNTPTILDATYAALDGVASSDDVIIGWDTYDPRGGAYITRMLGQQTETAADSSATVWRGWSWKYYINGEEADLYATNIAVQDGDVITWIYEYCEEPIV